MPSFEPGTGASTVSILLGWDDLNSAIEASPSMEEAHYRLAQAYRKTGETASAQKEIELYQKLSRESEQARERERSEIQQFVFELRRQ